MASGRVAWKHFTLLASGASLNSEGELLKKEKSTSESNFNSKLCIVDQKPFANATTEVQSCCCSDYHLQSRCFKCCL